MSSVPRFKALKRTLSKLGRILLSTALTLTSLAGPLVAPTPVNATIASGMPAIDVIGQFDGTVTNRLAPSFVRGAAAAGANGIGLYNPYHAAYDSVGHRMFVVDRSNSRILVYATDVDGDIVGTPTNVLGQPIFYADTANRGGSAAANTLNFPSSAVYHEVTSRLYVTDSSNHRILVYDLSAGITNGMAASHVLGQADFTSGSANRGGSVAANTLSTPAGLALDTANSRLIVADNANNRVLIYDLSAGITDGMAASNELGQADFTIGSVNRGGSVAANTLRGPVGIALDSVGARLFVADSTNHRVLSYNYAALSDGMAASNELGQSNFTTGTANRGGAAAANTLSTPWGLGWDAANSTLYVTDVANQRVLTYGLAGGITDGMAASHVLGQADMVSVLSNRGGSPASNTLSNPRGVTVLANGHVLVVETINHRIISFDVSGGVTDGMAATAVYGQYTNASLPINANTPTFTQSIANSFPFGLSAPAGLYVDSTYHRLFVSDQNHNRVLVYNLGINDKLLDYLPDYVLGQPDFVTVSAGTSQAKMTLPSALDFDPVRNWLFVAELSNNRALVFDLSSGITNGMNASWVIGQPNFTSTANGAGSGQFNGGVSGLAWDAQRKVLFAADFLNSRVEAFDLTGTPSNGMAAAYALAISYGTPRGMAYDPNLKRLFVAGTDNMVIGVYDATTLSSGIPLLYTLGSLNTSGSAQNRLSNPMALAYDIANGRLFTVDYSNNRVVMFDVRPNPSPSVAWCGTTTTGIANGMNASCVIGQSTWGQSAYSLSATGLRVASGTFNNGAAYDAVNQRLYIGDRAQNRVMVYDVSTSTGTVTSTKDGSLTLSRLAAGSSASGSLSFALQHNLSSTLTVTFPAGFTVTGAPTVGASSSCLSNLQGSGQTITADKTNCAGTVTLGGFAVTLPSAPGAYRVSWVNDDPGFATVYIVGGDTLSVSATVDPMLTFDVGSSASCTGSFASTSWSVDFGRLSTGRLIASSGDSSVPLICTRLSTNAASGAVVTVRNANGTSGLVSVSNPADFIPSAAAAVTSGTPGYGLCYSTVPGDSGYDTGLTPAALAPSTLAGSFSPAGTCTGSVVSGGESVAALSTSPLEVWRVAGVTSNAFAALRLKTAISATQPAHNDYSDSLTFVATATY